MRTIAQILKKSKYNENQLEYFLSKCFIDYAYFAEHVLGFDIADYHRHWYHLIEKYPRLSLTAFRGSGKTNFVAGYYVWKSIFSEGLNFLILSNTFEQSKMVLKIIRGFFTGNELLKNYIPDSRDATWKATELSIKTDANFYCKTYGPNVKGLRIDYLLCDEAGQYEDKSSFWTDASPTVQLNRGRIIVIGTPESAVDLLSELGENEEYYSEEFPAELDGKPLWPQKYTCLPHDTNGRRSLVAIRKEIGELPYTQEFLLIPISSANSLYPYELTSKCVDEDMTFMPFGKKSDAYYIGYDMAISKDGDYTVMTVLSSNTDGKKIVKALRFRDNFDEQKRRLKQLFTDFAPLKTIMDATGLGDVPGREIQKEFYGVQLEKFTFDMKYKLLLDLRQEFERLNITIPASKADIKTYGYSQQLLKELNDFALKIDVRNARNKVKFHSGEYDDTVISLALANRASQNVYGNISIRSI